MSKKLSNRSSKRPLSASKAPPEMSYSTNISPEVADVYFEFKNSKEKLTYGLFIKKLLCEGINIFQDNRVKEVGEKLKAVDKDIKYPDMKLDFFNNLAMVNKDLILRALKKELNIPDFQSYYKMIETIFDVAQFNYSGEVVLLAPQMMADKEKLWALSLCSSDGQRAEFGQSSVPVVMQAINKIFLYGLALELMGSTYIHSHVGVEYVKTNLHDLYLNKEGIPHNAFTYAGTLVICALIISVGMKCMDMSQKFEAYLLYMRNLSFKKKMYFNNTMLLYEKNRSQYMKSIAYFLKAYGCIPNDCNVDSLLDFYYQASALEVTCEELALMGGTLANNGVNPISGKQIYSKENNRCLLSAMKMYGIYNISEEFSFNVGLPVKSSITGHILLIIPGIASFAMYSPLVDKQGISKRGKEFCKALSSESNIHPYDPEQFTDLKNILTKESNELCSIACPLFAAAWKGDLPTLANLLNSGFHICQKDFSQRTILHLAASRGHLNVVKYLITLCPELIEFKDCMGKTAKDDAALFCQKAVCNLLEEWGTIKHASEAKESLKGTFEIAKIVAGLMGFDRKINEKHHKHDSLKKSDQFLNKFGGVSYNLELNLIGLNS